MTTPHETAWPARPAPRLTLLAELTVLVGDVIDVGPTHAGDHRVIPIIGGTAHGPRVRGTVLPLGADWNTGRRDGHDAVWAKYLIRTDDGVVLTVTNEGVVSGGAAGLSGVTRPRVDAPDGAYAWLRDAVLVGSIADAPGEVTDPAVAITLWTVDVVGVGHAS